MPQQTDSTDQKQLEAATRAYYTHYYRDQLRLPDWTSRIASRLNEEQVFGEPVIRKIEYWLNYNFQGKRVLVVGAGTGAESVTLARRGAEVFGIEPNRQALKILHQKTRLNDLNPQRFVAAVAESIPFPDNFFDFVLCYTVLEHVRDVEYSLDEMIRVCKPEAYVFIQTPDYRFPIEGHYKIPLIPFAPKWIQAIYLRLCGRPTRFLKSVNFLTAPKLDRLLWRRNVITMRVFEPHLLWWYHNGNWLSAWFCRKFAVHKNQNIFLKKYKSEEIDANSSGSEDKSG